MLQQKGNKQMTKTMIWAVIENAGHNGEQVVADNFSHWMDAYAYIQKQYDEDEIETLHIDVAHWDSEQECWSYDH